MAQTIAEINRLLRKGGFVHRVFMGTDENGTKWYYTGCFDPRPDRIEVIDYLKQWIPTERKTRRRSSDAIESIFKH